MKIQLAKKEQYRMLRTKTTIIVLGLLIVLVMIPLSDYSFYKQTPLELTAQDFLRLLSCGGGTFLGFSINYILFNIVCVGLIFHSEFVNKTFLYEKMHGISMMQSLGQRFLIVTEIVLVENIFFVVLFMVFSIKNGQPGLAIITITLKFIGLFIIGLQIAFVMIIATYLIQNAWKAFGLLFVRYLVGGFLWGSVADGVSENLRIQYLAVDPFNCVQAMFETELIMNNDVILLGIIILSFVINVGIWLAIVKAVQK